MIIKVEDLKKNVLTKVFIFFLMTVFLIIFFLNGETAIDLVILFIFLPPLYLNIFYLLFMRYKEIIITDNEVFLYYAFRPFCKRKKLNVTKIKKVYLKDNGFLYNGLVCISCSSSQLPFLFDIYVSSKEDSLLFLNQLTKINSELTIKKHINFG